jgi:type IV pilus assembly protein PilM
MSTKAIRFYTDMPLFGLDIGRGTLKVMQLDAGKRGTSIVGYGTANFDIHALDNGVITDPKAIAVPIRDMFRSHLIGNISARRVAMSIPAYRTFSRSIQVPKLSEKELEEAVQLEIEQYVPIPLDELYLDFNTTSQTGDKYELFVVAVPRKIVDSYLLLAQKLGLETVLIEPTTASCARFFAKDRQSDMTTIIIDFGSLTANVSVFEKTILATTTAPTGGMVLTEAIRDTLRVSIEEAGFIKTKYGLNASMVQKKIIEALDPVLAKLIAEIRRMQRYYTDHYSSNKAIEQIVILGGGANVPGLGEHLTDTMKIPVRTINHPWALFDSDGLALPMSPDRLMYATVAGLSLAQPKEVFMS